MTKSQLLAAGVTLTAITVMLAPLRRGPDHMQTQHASFVPLFAASGVAETNAFRRLASIRPENACQEPQVRTPAADLHRPPAPKTSAASLDYDFSAPRLRWTHLTAGLRAALDELLARPGGWQSIELHGSSVAVLDQLDRMHRRVRGSSTGHPYHLVLADGGIAVRPAVTPTGVLHLCLIGDFDTASPSDDQFAALDEVMDYLAIKLGALPVRPHGCLSTAFPAGEIITSLDTGH